MPRRAIVTEIRDLRGNSWAGAHSNITRLGLRFPGTSRFRESNLEKRCGRVGRLVAECHHGNLGGMETKVPMHLKLLLHLRHCRSEDGKNRPCFCQAELEPEISIRTCDSWASFLHLPEPWMVLSSRSHAFPVRGSSWEKQS